MSDSEDDTGADVSKKERLINAWIAVGPEGKTTDVSDLTGSSRGAGTGSTLTTDCNRSPTAPDRWRASPARGTDSTNRPHPAPDHSNQPTTPGFHQLLVEFDRQLVAQQQQVTAESNSVPQGSHAPSQFPSTTSASTCASYSGNWRLSPRVSDFLSRIAVYGLPSRRRTSLELEPACDQYSPQRGQSHDE
ncbi:hypothetical protein [Halorientalis regularis]|uniref:Uncharacterized protein n=1 Tax=Halorientalis regularis TaxID=660518 RepID=A0A1G7PKV3_9EURY|nr:hypothetical protein [Halorientalis regularis]SDF86945.1 hypothetical protein SAMN05216218_110176 [Halorientalis regularis]